MRQMTLSALALAIVANSAATPAAAARCAPRDVVAARLQDKYGEARRAQGLTANGQLLTFWASGAAGSWTVTVTSPAGRTCLLASGEGFVALDGERPADGDDA